MGGDGEARGGGGAAAHVVGAIMYHSSTQRRHWTFRDEDELAQKRAEANRKYRSKAAASGKVRGSGGGGEGESGPGAPWSSEGRTWRECQSAAAQSGPAGLSPQGPADRPRPPGASRGASDLQVLREAAAGFLRSVQAGHAKICGGEWPVLPPPGRVRVALDGAAGLSPLRVSDSIACCLRVLFIFLRRSLFTLRVTEPREAAQRGCVASFLERFKPTWT